MDTSPSLLWPVEACLGEGPIWLAATQQLAFVDIKGGKLHFYTPDTNTRNSVEIGGNPSFVLPVADDEGTSAAPKLVIGNHHALHLYHNGIQQPALLNIPMPTHNRTNDATVDCHGRIWFGTMDDEEQQKSGQLYCYAEGVLHAMGCAAMVTNGPAISADGRTLYHVDSAARQIWRYTIDEGPSLSAPHLFLQLSEEDGYPDGVVLDSEGALWVALWDGWGVRRYAPDGALLAHIALPCARVTKIAFGGTDYRTVYVTTARVGLDAASLEAQPLAGGLFTFRAPAPGLPLPHAKICA
jgi:xylono-1,5-lactonase